MSKRGKRIKASEGIPARGPVPEEIHADMDIICLPNIVAPTDTLWRRGCAWLKIALSTIAYRLHVPGAIRDVEITDEVTGQHLRIRVSRLFTRVSVDGRDYFFDRLSGRFDGTGMGCS